MNIKTRLSFQFTLIVAGILLIFSVLVYYFSYTSQRSKFRDNLLDRARNTAVLLINVSEVDSALLKKIHMSTVSWQEEEIAITDSDFNMLYSNNISCLSGEELKLNSGNFDLNYFSLKGKDCVYLKHQYKNNIYNVFVAAYDKARNENLSALRNILFWSILFSVFLSVIFSYFFSKKAIQPISRIIKSVKQINYLKLNKRLDEGNSKDEIARLAKTFNEMLTNLEVAFKNQEDFVSNASHELRTPLAVMISESDYLLSRERSKTEYIEHISGLINDLKNINVLLNNLLELAQINNEKNIKLSPVRVDEIMFNVIQKAGNKYKDRKIILRIQYPEKNDDLFVSGNEGLLEIAFKNLLDNACKFSNGDVCVEFSITDKTIIIAISDKGIGIPSHEIDKIYQPFKRASNVKYIGGFGVGLSLVSKIMELHKVKMEIVSAEFEGTCIILHFNRLKE